MISAPPSKQQGRSAGQGHHFDQGHHKFNTEAVQYRLKQQGAVVANLHTVNFRCGANFAVASVELPKRLVLYLDLVSFPPTRPSHKVASGLRSVSPRCLFRLPLASASWLAAYVWALRKGLLTWFSPVARKLLT